MKRSVYEQPSARPQPPIPRRRTAQAVMVGDREHDVYGAKENGLEVIGVLYGYGSREELTRAGADELVENPEALLQILEIAG